jgi:DegV family protein with EDD domain
MDKVAIVTDSIAAISKELAEEYGITAIPFYVHIDGKAYLDGTIDMKWLYSRLERRGNLPTTSFPSAADNLQAYQRLAQSSKYILRISMNAAFTGGYQAAIDAKEMARELLPGTRIEIVDSRTVEGGQLLVVIEGARAAKEGKDITEICGLLDKMIPKVRLLQASETLFYRDKGGRIFEAKSWAEAQSSQSFKTIIEVDASTNGITRPVARAKTKGQIMEKMVSIVKEQTGNRKLHAAIVHGNVPEQAEQLKNMLLSQCHCEKIYITENSAASGVHNGPGFVSLGFYSCD